MSGFYTETDLADMLGATDQQVAEWRRRYSWPHVKIGRQVRFTEADVRAITSKHHVAGPKSEGLPDQTSRSIARSA